MINIDHIDRMLKVHITDSGLHTQILSMSAFAHELVYTDRDGVPVAWDMFINDNSTACAVGLLRLIQENG